MEKFRALGLSENVLEAIEKKGFTEPSEIQEKTIPLLLSGTKDIVGQAQTGTGKTAAFGLPLIEQLDDNSRFVQAIILCPTRELAIQVAEEVISFKNKKRLSVLPIYGGQSYTIQIGGLKKGVQIVVGTPGRVRDHIEKGTLKLDHVTHVVLDEADEMLNMGFEEEVREILTHVPQERRMLLFSATMPQNILRLAKTFMKDYDFIEVKKQQVATENVDQQYFEVRESDRFNTLSRILDTEPEFYGIIFCRTKVETDRIADQLIDRGYDAEGIHGDVTQSQRELILKKFKLKKVNILVATDVAARGIDVSDLTHVINYNLPQDPEAYVHRIGRTGRAGKHGTAITIISPSEMRDLLFIQKIARAKLRKETVPSIEDVVQTKTMKLKTDLQAIIDKKEQRTYSTIAKEILEENENKAEEIIAALLRFSMKDTLREESYGEISSVTSRSNAPTDSSKARLFVAKGHEDNMNAEKVANFLATEAGVDPSCFLDVRVFDRFTFVTAPLMEAEQILVVFDKKKGRGRPMVTRAKEKEGGRSEDRGFGNKGFDKKSKGGFSSKPSYNKEKSYEPKKDFNSRDRKPRESFGDNRKREGGFKKEDSNRPKKRENKLTNYLDSPPASENRHSKPAPKKEHKPAFDFNKDDLSW